MVEIMNEGKQNLLSTAALYRLATKLHTAVPYHLSRRGYAFPTWHYYLEMTRRCNLRCVMCQYINWLKSTPTDAQMEGELAADEWFKVIEAMPRFALATFTGGEPFVRPDFLDILEHASARCRTHVITNATLLTEERARRCVECAPRRMGQVGLNFMGVSLDGPPDIHNGIRGLSDAFERSAEGVRLVHEIRRTQGKRCPMVHVTSVIQAANVDALHEMPRIVKELGADIFNLTLEIRNQDLPDLGVADPATYGGNDVPYPRIDPQRLAGALARTRVAAQRHNVELRMPDMPDTQIVKYYNGHMALADFRCGSLWTNIVVASKGDVYACWLKRLGNVRETPMARLWNGPEMRAFRCKTRQRLYAPCAGCCFQTYDGKRRETT